MLRSLSKQKVDAHFIEIVKGSAVAFTVKVLSAAGSFLLNLVVARQLGAEQAGYFYLAFSILMLLSALSMQGFNNALVRFVAGYKALDDRNSVAQVYTMAVLRITPVATVVGAILWVLSEWFSISIFNKPELKPSLATMALAVLPIAISQMHGYVFQGLKQIVASMMSISAALPLILIPLLLFVQPIDATQVAASYVVVTVVIAFLTVAYWLRCNIPRWILPKSGIVQEVNKTLKPLFVIVLMNQVTMWAGQLMLGSMATASDVAVFATAQRTALLTSFILVAVNTIAAPKFAAAYKLRDLVAIRKTAIGSGRMMVFFAVPALLFMLIFAELLMGWFGQEFRVGADILRILAVGQFVNVITGSVAYLLQMTGREKLLRNNVAIASSIMLIGGPIAVHLYGIQGIAVVTAISVGVQNLLSVYQVEKQLGFNTLRLW